MTMTSHPPALPDAIELVVVGAHLSGLPLNAELLALGATLVRATRTAPVYRLFELPGTTPRKPGLLRTSGGDGSAIDVEVWSLRPDAFGAFVSRIPSPLGIGTLQLADGSAAKGFLVEACAVAGALDISTHGGWRRYLKSLAPASA
jgi:allophanate hydrolase